MTWLTIDPPQIFPAPDSIPPRHCEAKPSLNRGHCLHAFLLRLIRYYCTAALLRLSCPGCGNRRHRYDTVFVNQQGRLEVAMRLAETPPLEIAALEVVVYRAPIETPVRAAMGTMTDRPAVLARAVDDSGAVGFGEVWCNFPTCGAEHRARLVESVLAPMVVGRT